MSRRPQIRELAKSLAKESMVTDVVAKLVEQICVELHDYYSEKMAADRKRYIEAARGLPVYVPPSQYDIGREDAAKAIESLASQEAGE